MCSLWNFIESEIIAAAATIETAVRNGEQMDSCANLHLWDKYWKDWIVLIISIIIQGTVIEVTTTTAITIRHTDRQTWESCASQRGERLNETEHNNNSKKNRDQSAGWWWFEVDDGRHRWCVHATLCHEHNEGVRLWPIELIGRHEWIDAPMNINLGMVKIHEEWRFQLKWSIFRIIFTKVTKPNNSIYNHNWTITAGN